MVETTMTVSEGMFYGAFMSAMIMLSVCIPLVIALTNSGSTRIKVALGVGLTLILPVTVAAYLGYCIAATAREAPRLLQKMIHNEPI